MGVVKRRTKKEEKKAKPVGGKRAFPVLRMPGSPWGEAFLVLVLLVDFFFMATVLTPWTGEWGRILSSYSLGYVGGAILLPELFVAYLVIGELLSRRVPGLLKQSLGTGFLFLCTSLLLGLVGIQDNVIPFRFVEGGMLGDGMAHFLLTNLGPLGTTFCGLALVVLAWLFLSPDQGRGLWAKCMAAFLSFGDRMRNLIPRKRPVAACGALGADAEIAEEEGFHPEEAEEETPVRRVLTGRTEPANIEPREASADQDLPFSNPQPITPPPVEEETVSDLPSEGHVDDQQLEVARGEDNLQSHFEKENVGEGEAADLSSGEDEELVFPPPISLFGPSQDVSRGPQTSVLEKKGFQIISTLSEFGIEAELAEMMVGPTVVQYRLQLAPGIKVSRVAGLSNDLAVALAVPSLRVEAPIPGKPFVGVEIPNPVRQSISLRQIVEKDNFLDSDYDLPLPVGCCVDGQSLVIGLEDLPHLLVAGTTGSGKSVFVNSCIVGLCATRSPKELKLLLVDPKRVEMSFYEKLPHTLVPPIVDAKKAIHALAWAVREMERRYELFASCRVRNLAGFNGKAIPKDQLPHIVIVVDELADLMMTAPKEVEDYICRLAQMARATGIHLLLATQRPSVNVITGLIKANIPARVAFTLPSQADSRTIIDVSGAERLLGKGDMLFLSPRFPKAIRVQSPWIEEGRILALIDYLVRLFGEPEHIDIEAQGSGGGSGQKGGNFEDPLLEDAIHTVLNTGIASASRLQRQLRVGFTRAARLVDAMEDMGIVGPPDGSKPREILVDDERAEEILSEALGG